MSKHILPTDGSVLIVDDKISEARPLMEMFAKEGIATTYYSGIDDDKLPEKPKQKVRLALFDIQLFPGGNEKNYASTILNVLEKLVPHNNGPFILILWSIKRESYVDDIIDIINSSDLAEKPLCILKLEKRDFFKSYNDEDDPIEDLIEDIKEAEGFNNEEEKTLERIIPLIRDHYTQHIGKILKAGAISKLRKKISEELSNNANAFQFFNFWETVISKASGQVVRKFSEFHNGQEDWDQRVKYDLYHLAQAQTGNNNDEKIEKEIVKNSLKTLNQSFVDEMSTQLNQFPDLSQVININQSDLTHTEKVEIDEQKYRLIWQADNNNYQFKSGDNVDLGGPAILTDLNRKFQKKSDSDPNKLAYFALVKKFEEVKINTNTNLHIDENPPIYIQPGNVYGYKIEPDRKKELLKTYFSASKNDNETFLYKLNKETDESNPQKTEIKSCFKEKLLDSDQLERIKFIELEVSPPCDLANNKFIKHRMLPGLLLPNEVFRKFKRNTPDCIYDSVPTFLYYGDKFNLLFDFRLFKSYDIEILENLEKPILRLKHELHADIISKLSSHISRLGISVVK